MAWVTRFLAAVAFLAVGVLFSPEIFGSKSMAQLSTYLKLAHLLSFSTAFGAALWVTFIGGIIMFKNLPRHQFGNLQSKMFPAYFSMVGICSAISVASFGYLHPWKSASTVEKYQLGFLLSSFAFNMTNLFVFTPMTVEMMKQRHKVERESNIGEEVGLSKNREVAKSNPKLAAMNKKFGMIHGFSSLANIMSFGSLAMHSWYLAGLLASVMCPTFFVPDPVVFLDLLDIVLKLQPWTVNGLLFVFLSCKFLTEDTIEKLGWWGGKPPYGPLKLLSSRILVQCLLGLTIRVALASLVVQWT